VPAAALGLVGAGAVLHAVWNLVAKGNRGGVVFFWLAALATAVAYAPAFALRVTSHPIAPEGWPWIAGSAAVHGAYLWSLHAAYRRADLSVAYPIARGTGPAIVFIVSLAALREPLSVLGILGIVTVVGGVYAVGFASRTASSWQRRAAALIHADGRYALLTGLCVAGYTLVDREGVRRVDPMVFGYLSIVLGGLLLTPLVLRQGGTRPWRQSGARTWRVAVVGVLMAGAYFMVLFAFRLAPTAYVAAARELSTVLGAALGMTVLGEPAGVARVAAAAAIAAGVGLIALA